MKISEAIKTLQAQRNFERTPTGRSIAEYGIDALNAVLDDKKNWENEVIKCLNCCIIMSSLLTPKGCPNCGGHDLTTQVRQADILQ
jgi:rubrerythrin